MLKRLKQLTIAMVAMVAMATPAMAATIIDFRNGNAAAGGTITFDGTNVFGTDLPIGIVEILGAPRRNGVYDVDGRVFQPITNPQLQDGTYGDLDFDTRTGNVTLSGCIPGLGVGIVEGVCTNPVLLQGTITGHTVDNKTGGATITFTAFDAKNPDLIAAIGLPQGTPFVIDTFALLTDQFTEDDPTSMSVSTDVRNTAVPEPATMMLLGAGLLAAFKARRRHQQA